MSSEFGNKIRISIFGESHGKAIGVLAQGLPAGETVDTDKLSAFLARRKPGKSPLSTPRNEADEPIFLSGIVDSVICGTPLCAIIENKDTHSGDYSNLTDTVRPSHADYTAFVRYGGNADMRGGGHFSGRLTAPLCIIGGIAKQILEKRGVHVGAHLYSVGAVNDEAFPMMPDNELFEAVAQKGFPVIDDKKGEEMKAVILEAAQDGDSVGGIVECAVTGLPAGLGDPMFDGIENRLANVIFGIPAIKGVEFGAGFAAAQMRGSECNDDFTMADDKVMTETNNSGGIQGGITNGMPVVFRAAVKPTPSISKTQNTVSLLRQENAPLSIKGRHDPCIAHRAVPVIEAAAACVVLDIMSEYNLL